MSKAAVLAVLGVCLPAFGWGPEGHNLVARIALARLKPATRTRVAGMLGPDQTMVSVSSWADRVRTTRKETGPWHFVDIPLGQPHLDMTRDCGKGDCIVAVIERFRAVLKNPATPPDERKDALMFLIHFVGDLHQPLHSSDNHDHGGNEVHLEFLGRNINLHSLWDTALLARMGTEDELYARFLEQAQKHRKKWAKGSVEDWAEESHWAGENIVYGLLPKGTPAVINEEYERQADPVIAAQIEKAGLRLAVILNAVLP